MIIRRRLDNITDIYENTVNILDNRNTRVAEIIFITIMTFICVCILLVQYKKAQQILEEDRSEMRRPRGIKEVRNTDV